jgi:hypothetical protein
VQLQALVRKWFLEDPNRRGISGELSKTLRELFGPSDTASSAGLAALEIWTHVEKGDFGKAEAVLKGLPEKARNHPMVAARALALKVGRGQQLVQADTRTLVALARLGFVRDALHLLVALQPAIMSVGATAVTDLAEELLKAAGPDLDPLTRSTVELTIASLQLAQQPTRKALEFLWSYLDHSLARINLDTTLHNEMQGFSVGYRLGRLEDVRSRLRRKLPLFEKALGKDVEVVFTLRTVDLALGCAQGESISEGELRAAQAIGKALGETQKARLDFLDALDKAQPDPQAAKSLCTSFLAGVLQ